jgi:hypothetical protein
MKVAAVVKEFVVPQNILLKIQGNTVTMTAEAQSRIREIYLWGLEVRISRTHPKITKYLGYGLTLM